MNNALCRALLVILQSANPNAGNLACDGRHGVVSTSPAPGSTESAHVEDDGTIVVTVRRMGAAQTQIRVPPDDPRYGEVRSQIGALLPGEEVPLGQ